MVATEGLNISDRYLNDFAFFKPGFLYGAIPAIEADDSVSLEQTKKTESSCRYSHVYMCHRNNVDLEAFEFSDSLLWPAHRGR